MTEKTTIDTSKPGVLIVNGKKFRGKVFQLPTGQVVELYPIQVLARALNRTDHAIRLWERAGEIPKPLFRIASSSPAQEQRRYYSRVQIVNLHQAHNRFPFSAGRPHMRLAFFALFNAVFDEGEIIDVAGIRVPSPQSPRVIGKRASHSETHRPSAQNSQPQSRGTLAPPVEHAHTNAAQQSERLGGQPQPAGETTASGGRYPASAHPRTEEKKPDYRRRPSGGA